MKINLIVKFLEEIEKLKVGPKIIKDFYDIEVIEEKLDFIRYDEYEEFCSKCELIIKEKNMLSISKVGKEILENKSRINEIFIMECCFKSKFSNEVIPGLVEFKNKNNKLVYDKSTVYKLFGSDTKVRDILNEVGLLIPDKEGKYTRINPKYQKNKTLEEYSNKNSSEKKPITQETIDKDLEKKKQVGKIAEKWVLEYEKIRLRKGKHYDEAEKVKQISQDWANKGYDIESFEGESENMEYDRFIEVKGSTGKNFSIFWSQNEIKVAEKLGMKYWIYFISEIDLENGTKPNDPERIQNPFYRIDPLNEDPTNTEFSKNTESIHVTKKKEN
jgi:hypothetical protein